MIKTLWRLSREAIRYRMLYIIAILSTLALTAVNLAAPKLLSAMTGIVEAGVDQEGLHTIGLLTVVLVGLYLMRILFRFLSNYLAHKAAWYLVGDLRTRTYDKLEHMHLGYFHDKQTGDLMSRIGDFCRRPGRPADHQLETGVDHLCADPPDLHFGDHLFKEGSPVLPDLPEKDGGTERQTAGQPFRHP